MFRSSQHRYDSLWEATRDCHTLVERTLANRRNPRDGSRPSPVVGGAVNSRFGRGPRLAAGTSERPRVGRRISGAITQNQGTKGRLSGRMPTRNPAVGQPVGDGNFIGAAGYDPGQRS